MQTIKEIGVAVARRRQDLKLKQGVVAEKAGITQECLSRFERGRALELGSRKLLAVLAVLEMELQLLPLSTNPMAGELDLTEGPLTRNAG
ncbi:helix-turn-helix domain-containing protein [Xanthomonas arboricola]|uniref:helix-turn-helix domain-containing protein n=1 Tax=Xanthomonas arboricola TaxID=56448 RepID=UPI0012D2BD79|nr:helix-turn-helix transcriptional regulator [Xanthomonas arboricola]